MVQFTRSPVTAVLGPTNTGKTHLAVERMCGHSSGMMGFPLRLLAREVYDRVVAIKGPAQVALITGEEKIVPPQARYFLCTAESMPLGIGRQAGAATQGQSDYAFVALDEAQIGADPERGHIFTDRLLRARGREETMILGSASIARLVKSLIPDVDIIGRPRFSTLSYAGAKKLSRLPKRSAIVAFSAEEVYAVAEMLRRFRGGAAVVMGALSPRTRNAQVQMFLNGEVDYLVATDAIGMGLNLDVAHVAFASLRKFDGRRSRRLTVAEMAQIAGRAGRHHKDGTFGSLGGEDGHAAFTPEEIEAIEAHRFPPIEHLYWRDGAPRLDSLATLVADLETRPDRPELRAAPEAVDLAVLKRMAADPQVIDRVRGPRQVARLWDACGLPDFQKLGADHHARTVNRIWQFLSEGNGHIPRDWFAQQLARLDSVQGDIDTLSGRIAAARTWAYIAHRADWLAHPAEMAERTRALEEKLSDALHAALTQRFVDRRTTVLLRDIGQNVNQLPVTVEPDGNVCVDGETIGRLDGFRFSVDPATRHQDRKLLLAAAERRLGKVLRVKADELIGAADVDFALLDAAGDAPCIAWNGTPVATLLAGPTLLTPEIRLDRAILALDQDVQKQVSARLTNCFDAQKQKHLLPLVKMAESAADPQVPPVVRAVFAQLGDAGGVSPRTDLDSALGHLDKDQRHLLRRAGIDIGVLDLYHPGLLKPGAARWRGALLAARIGKPCLPLPLPGLTLIPAGEKFDQMGARIAGFRTFGEQMLRIDMAERMARTAHEAIAKGEAFTVASPQIVSLGLSEPAFLALMRAAGFRPVEGAEEGKPNWTFKGRQKARAPQQQPAPAREGKPRSGRPAPRPAAATPARAPAAPANNAFAGLAALLGRNG
ncbi:MULTISPECIES: helicase-related protein [unclassified Sphingobium]|uniref:helicase-related protein n=1 Tax=unclassified Sphingobium TaxID=2611147 RepID=UPI000D156A84|nr:MULTISPECIES: helicase-related protein [unclassified Sphingobium]MBG6119495.1 ATP-dependent RNA helicase SUPV3L1/SUV3 [Sphingobium sp. JAI105]PSO13401.1 helicase [Sphingobium sp. AEW4]TWD11652.1 ATP-dependent RNA helicase SUPV3L1/SUV3 [Sphingobium sp. AEW010]TWD28457.1 ATP-dependent RNA helicase SUPV3L1/SUV3 [Sphingobium sp. AEW013]TWD30194.1 ATP-dependent RNA helicase SUPV3L1/SUV3 [Sphingobium sp. AEW001]